MSKQYPIMYRQHGISLVELLVASAVGLFLMGGIIQLLVSSKNTYRAEDALARLQESGRFAIQVIAHDLRMNGNMGCRSLKLYESMDNALCIVAKFGGDDKDDCKSLAFSPQSITPIGYESGSEDWSIDSDTYSWASGTDVLELFGVMGQGAHVTNAMSSARTEALVIGGTRLGISEGDLLLVTDCVGADLFKASAVAGTSISHQTTAGGEDDGATYNTSSKFSRAYNYPGDVAAGIAGTATRAMLFPFSRRTYFIGQNGDAERSLLVIEDGGAPQALVEGVQSMNVTYAEDTGTPPDQAPDVYRSADNVANWDQVYSARVELLLHSDDQMTSEPLSFTFNGAEANPDDDRRLRKRFATTVSLRSRAM